MIICLLTENVTFFFLFCFVCFFFVDSIKIQAENSNLNVFQGR